MQQKNGMDKRVVMANESSRDTTPPVRGVKFQNASRIHPYLREGCIFPCCNKKKHETD